MSISTSHRAAFLVVLLVVSLAASRCGAAEAAGANEAGGDGATSTLAELSSSLPMREAREGSDEEAPGTSLATTDEGSAAAIPGETHFSSAMSHIYIDGNLTAGVVELERSAALGYGRSFLFLAVLHAHGLEVAQSEAKAVVYLEFGAMAGVPEANAALAYRYQYGIGVPQSCTKAEKHARAAAAEVATGLYADIRPKLHHTRLGPPSASSYPKLQRNGHGNIIATNEEFIQHHLYRAEKGNADSMMVVGFAFMHGTHGLAQDGNEALRYFELALAHGETAAYGALGQLYATGMSYADPPIPRDVQKAEAMFNYGAAAGNPASFNGLGYLYANRGAGDLDATQAERDKNFGEAYGRFEQAAGTGNVEGIYNLAVLLLHGKGVKQNVARGIELLVKAASSGNLLAHWQLGQLTNLGLAGLTYSCSTTLSHYKVLLEHGAWHDAISSAKMFHDEGKFYQSLLDYLIAAETGIAVGKTNAAHILESGAVTLVKPTDPSDRTYDAETQELTVRRFRHGALVDGDEARDEIIFGLLLRNAAEGDHEAALKLGDWYYDGIGTEVDKQKAVEYYRQSAARRNPQALFNLGLMHQYGEVGKSAQSGRKSTRSELASATDSAAGGQAASEDKTKAEDVDKVLDEAAITADFHLAKRYFDESLQSNPDAAFAVNAALTILNFQWWYLYASNNPGWVNFWPQPYGFNLDDFAIVVLTGLVLVLLLIRNHAARG